jgi:hypothetical protein
MKEFEQVTFDPAKCRVELDALRILLDSKEHLSERRDLLPFFKTRKQLSALIGAHAGTVGPAPLLAFEFPFLGDFAADLIVGDREQGEFTVIEFEDGGADSIFTRAGKKSTKEWSRRFDHGFSQLVDWFHALDDMKRTSRFAKDFGYGHVRFLGLLLIGRRAGLTQSELDRLRWRAEKVRVDSHTIDCLTFDDLHDLSRRRLSYFPRASEFDQQPPG